MEAVYEEMYGVPCNMSLWNDLQKVVDDCILPACLKPQHDEGKQKPLTRVIQAMKQNPVELSWVADFLKRGLCDDQQLQQELEEEKEKEAKSEKTNVKRRPIIRIVRKTHDHDLLNPGLICNEQQQQQQQEEAKFETTVKRPIIRIVRKRPEDLLKSGLSCVDQQQEQEVKEAKPEKMNVDIVKRPIIKNIVKRRPDQYLLKPGLQCNDQQKQVQEKDAKPEKMEVHVVKRPTMEIGKRKRQEDDGAAKLEHATEKIRESYQRHAETKKRRMIQVVEHQDIVQVQKPKPKPMTSLAKKCLGDRKKLYASLAQKSLGDRKKL